MTKFSNKYVELEVKEGVLHVTFQKNAYITLEIAKDIVKQRLILMDSKTMPSIGLDLGMKGLEKEARDYLSSDEAIKLLSASALLVNSEFNKFLANFFLKVNVIKIKIPAKVFTEYNKAILWLENYK